jgi:NAD(P)H-hydrate epimerase
VDSLTRKQVRAIDAFAIDRLGIPGAVLMENAGRNAVAVIDTQYGVAGKAFAVLCGAGNNGGDGFVIARHLMLRGASVQIIMGVSRDKLSGDALCHFQIVENLNVPIHELAGQGVGRLADDLQGFDIVIDALGGTGISGPLRDPIASIVRQVNRSARPIIAIDIPTGLDCDTGQAHDPTICAAMTITFVASKVGFDGAGAYTGPVEVIDIGVDPDWILPRLDG